MWNGGCGQNAGGLSCLTFCTNDVFQTEYMKHTVLIIQIFQIPKLPWRTLCLTFSMRNLYVYIGQQQETREKNQNLNTTRRLPGFYIFVHVITPTSLHCTAIDPISRWPKIYLPFNTVICGELDWLRIQKTTKGSFIHWKINKWSLTSGNLKRLVMQCNPFLK